MDDVLPEDPLVLCTITSRSWTAVIDAVATGGAARRAEVGGPGRRLAIS
ncbi:hypothetical protein AB6O49_14410 [Streptomyces sp. SBR177]